MLIDILTEATDGVAPVLIRVRLLSDAPPKVVRAWLETEHGDIDLIRHGEEVGMGMGWLTERAIDALAYVPGATRT